MGSDAADKTAAPTSPTPADSPHGHVGPYEVGDKVRGQLAKYNLRNAQNNNQIDELWVMSNNGVNLERIDLL